MNSIIEIKNLSFSYGEKKILDDFHLSIERGKWLTLLGSNGSGKSTLIRMLTGLLPSSGIFVNGLSLEKRNLREIRSYIGVVFENPNNQLIGETVMDSIAFGLENLRYDRSVILDLIEEVASDLKIEDLLNFDIEHLSGGQKQLVALASVLVMHPRILILDEAFTMIDEVEKEKILKVLQKLHEHSGITIINVTHDAEESIFGDEIAILKDGKILIHDEKEMVYKKEKLWKEAFLELPFMVSLSKKLSYYHLVENPIYDMNEMVDYLWK